ncbi:MAG: DUF4340 domain-containing protein, partial [Schleiferiaceae bacterium]|jgi:hypothetical protein|nr:DUF4340 domain-containing protein [Schleiferiaceae bacterium]
VVVVAVLAGAGIYLATQDNQQKKGTTLANEHDFAIPDTASITRIVISDKTPAEVSLERIEGTWMVNKEAPARTDAIDVLLETFHHIAMKSYVPKEARETVLKRMDVFGKHVTVYSGETVLKSFLVGTETPDMLGSYMKLDEAKDPFAMYLPGFNGYLNSRFFTDESQWRKRTIWGFDNREIKHIEVRHLLNEGESFSIKSENDEVTLYDVDGNAVTDINVVKLHEYLAAFRNTAYEGAIVSTDGIYAKMDSVKSAGEIMSISVESKKGKKITLKTYRVKAEPNTFDINDQPRKWDPDRMYGVINDDTYVLVQNFGLQNVQKGLSDFRNLN